MENLKGILALNVIEVLKGTFARYGIPAVMVSDDGPQYDCAEMKQFAQEYGFCHITTTSSFPSGKWPSRKSSENSKAVVRILLTFVELTEQPLNLPMVLVQQNYSWVDGFEQMFHGQVKFSHLIGLTSRASRKTTSDAKNKKL